MKNPHEMIDKRLYKTAELIINKVEKDPVGAIENARRNLLEQRKVHGNAVWLGKWEKILDLPFDEIKTIVLKNDETGNEIRQTMPFTGLISNQERWAIIKGGRRE